MVNFLTKQPAPVQDEGPDHVYDIRFWQTQREEPEVKMHKERDVLACEAKLVYHVAKIQANTNRIATCSAS